jgi:hypothetical protein
MPIPAQNYVWRQVGVGRQEHIGFNDATRQIRGSATRLCRFSSEAIVLEILGGGASRTRSLCVLFLPVAKRYDCQGCMGG